MIAWQSLPTRLGIGMRARRDDAQCAIPCANEAIAHALRDLYLQGYTPPLNPQEKSL